MNQASSNQRQSKGVNPPNVTGTSKGTLPQTGVVSPTKGNANPPERAQQLTEKTAGSVRGQNTKVAGGQVAGKAGGTPKSVPKQPRQRETMQQPQSQTAAVENDGVVKPEDTRKDQKAGQSESAVGGETQINRNVLPVKPVLKKKLDNQPSGKRDKKQRSKQRSVTFLPEPDAASAILPIQKPVTIKPAKKTGFRELSAKDFSVILGFWSIRFFIPWVDSWHDFNFYFLREPSYWDPLEKDMRTQEIIVFCVMSCMTIAVSVLADLINFRFFIFLVLLLLFVFCPITGAIFNAVLVARAYNQDFYRKYAFTSNTLFHCTSAIAIVSFPIQLCCIFGQNEEMSRQAHYNWTAVLIFMEAINRYIAFLVIPGKCPTRTFTQAAIWVFIGAFIFTVLLSITNFSLEWARPEILHSNKPTKECIKYEEQDMAKLQKKCIWFFTILFLLVMTSFIFAMLENFRPHEDWEQHHVFTASSMFFMGKIIGAVFMVVVLTVVRCKLHHYHILPFLRPDVLALGLPHLINCIALLTLLGRVSTMSYLKEEDVIIGPIPDGKKMVIEFYNFDFRNRTVCVHSTSFRSLKVGPRHRGTREIYDLGSSRIYFTVSLDPQYTIDVKTVDSVAYQGDTWATFIITLPFNNIKYSDMEALYSKLEIVRVEGTQHLRPKKKPQLFIMNTFLLDSPGSYNRTFIVKQRESGFHRTIQVMLRKETVVLEVPDGHVEIEYSLFHNTLPPQTVSTAFEAENYGVWAVLLGHSRPMKKEERYPPRMMKTFKTMEIAGPRGRLPTKLQLQKDVAVMAGMALAGMASSGVFIGMIYLFWLDTPITYRTTWIGVFWVLSETPVGLFKTLFVKYGIGFTVLLALSLLQITCTVLHFIAATLFYTP